MKGPDRAPSSFKMPASTGLVLLRRSGLELIRPLHSEKTDLGRFDLIYAAGLYDYLDARVAARLTRILFEHLNEGGRLLIPNFLWGVPEEAYMEVFMDWYLLYRSREEIESFAQDLEPAEVRQTTYIEDAMGVIGYLEIERV